MSNVIVLNADFQVLHTTSLNHAIKMMYRGIAVADEVEEGRTIGPFPVPKVLRLVKYVYAKWKHAHNNPRYSRAGLFKRDSNMCAYCGRKGNTADHVYPVSRGGRTAWENMVTCCEKCNHKKRDRTPEEAGMPLLYKPYVPTYFQLNK